MPFPDLSILLDPEAVPDGIPTNSQSIGQQFRVVAGDGIEVQQTGSEVIISLAEDVRDDIQQVQSTADDIEDPLQHMGFRISYGAGAVMINKGYVWRTKWETDKWVTSEVEVNPGVIEIEPPFYVYAAIPMKQYTALTEVPKYDISDSVTIDSVLYLSMIGMKTDWTGLDEDKLLDASLTQQSIYEISTTEPENVSWPDDGKFRFVLGFVGADETVQQTHIGGFTLPQAFSPNIIYWSLA